MILEKRIMAHEGFRKIIYEDSLGKQTIGYGHLVTKDDHYEENVEYTKQELTDRFYKDLEKAREGADQLIGHITELHIEAKNVVIEMVFQLGTQGVRNFKKMILALEAKDYFEAHVQMLDSLWAKQTPQRCIDLSEIMKKCS
jgi:lysozyme